MALDINTLKIRCEIKEVNLLQWDFTSSIGTDIVLVPNRNKSITVSIGIINEKRKPFCNCSGTVFFELTDNEIQEADEMDRFILTKASIYHVLSDSVVQLAKKLNIPELKLIPPTDKEIWNMKISGIESN